jgi:polysaccharide pyruvyl transferase WcaK-like protein
MSLRILLMGYYGKGNFGDDVLLCVTHALLRTHYPDAQFSVVVDGAHGDYVKHMLGGVTVLPPGRHGHFDLIVHGGGGVFFDFKEYGLCARMKEYALRAIGFSRYVVLEKYARVLTNKPHSSANVRVGLGIGVGTYSVGSPRLRERLPVLADFKALWVRDAESIRNLGRFKEVMSGQMIRGSDLAFLTQHWLGKTLPEKLTRATKPRLGIALRDWPISAGGIEEPALKALLTEWSEHYEISGFILDAHADPMLQRTLVEYPLRIWQPQQMRMGDFAKALAAQDVLLTSRAHAAICGACVGTPSVIVSIEPKLQQVAAMLPHSAVAVAPNAPETWRAAIDAALAMSQSAIAGDVAANHAQSAMALEAVWGHLS